MVLLLSFIATPLYAEITLKSEWLESIDNLRFEVDLSIRGQYNIRSNHLSNVNVMGFDLHKVFTHKNGGDIATLVAQGYLTKLVNAEKPAPFYKNKDDLKFICRICNINFSVLDKGQLNLRIGHFEIPFGLEYNIDTNGTFRQYNNGRDIGGKLDWGLTANGQFSWGSYEVAASRGSGVDWTSDYHTYILSGRVEKNFNYASFFGFSAFHGHVKKPRSLTYINRTRFGVDASTQLGPMTWLAELSGGKDNNADIINALVEVNIQNNTESLLAYFQVRTGSRRAEHQDWDSMVQTNLGLRYTPDRNWTVSGQWTHDIETYKAAKKADTLGTQLRLRF